MQQVHFVVFNIMMLSFENEYIQCFDDYNEECYPIEHCVE